MGSSSDRKSGSSGRSTRKRVVIGAEETVRVRYQHDEPQVESERRSKNARQASKAGAAKTAAAMSSAAKSGAAKSGAAKSASGKAGAHKAGGTSGAGRQATSAANARGSQRQPSKRPPSRASQQAQRLSKAKREERERRQQLIRLRRSGIYAGVAAAVIFVLWGCVALYRAPLFPVETVEVSGVHHHTQVSILKLASIPKDATLPRLGAGGIEKRIEADPWIVDATVDRDFPGTVRITVTERKPSAVVDAGGTQLWVVSGDAVWLSKRSAEDTGLVSIMDVAKVTAAPGKRVAEPEVRNAVRVLAGLSEELRAMVRTVSAPSIDKTALFTANGVEIFVGEATDMAKKDRIVREILRQEKGKVVYINVRVVDSPTFRGLEGE